MSGKLFGLHGPASIPGAAEFVEIVCLQGMVDAPQQRMVSPLVVLRNNAHLEGL